MAAFRRVVAIVLLVFCVQGCSTPPNVQPFSEATQALSTAVSSSEKAIAQEVGKVDASQAATFSANWAHRIKAMQAMNDYAESLVGIVDAGEQSAAAAKETIKAAETLFATVGSVYPGASQVGQVLSGASVKAFERYAKDKSARTVAEALRAADPAVRDVAGVLAADFEELRGALKDLHTFELTAFILRLKADEPGSAVVMTLREQASRARVEMTTRPAQFDVYLKLQDQIDKELSRPWNKDAQEQLKAMNLRFAHYESLVSQAGALTRAWGHSHSKLIEASESNRTPAFTVLVEMSREMMAIYKEARNTK